MKQNLNNEELARLSDIYKQLSNPVRLKMLIRLQAGSACVSELCEVSGASQSATSQHLKKLRDHRLIKQKRQAQQIYYSLLDNHIEKLLENGIEHIQGGDCHEN
ncbi:MAG: ArsR/SmtB family transcription factor [Culicoidibacterales bacterium]